MPAPGAPVPWVPSLLWAGIHPPALPDVLPLMPGKLSPAAPGCSQIIPASAATAQFYPEFWWWSGFSIGCCSISRDVAKTIKGGEKWGERCPGLCEQGCHVPVPVLLSPPAALPDPPQVINRAQITSLHRWVPTPLSPWLHNIKTSLVFSPDRVFNNLMRVQLDFDVSKGG